MDRLEHGATRQPGLFHIVCPVLVAFLSLLSPLSPLSMGASNLRAEERIVFSGSIRAVPAENRAAEPMTAVDSAAPMEFMVALKMRDLPGLQARVTKGEIVSPAEMLARYYPLAAEYQAQVDWLTAQGFTLVQTDPSRLAVFASGTVDRVQQVFQVQFASVTRGGKTYRSAVTAPSLPASIAAPVLGINGLQPHLQYHRHSRMKALPAGAAQRSLDQPNKPPFLASEIVKAYSADGLSQAGAGQKIGIVIDTFPNDSDLVSFWATCGVPQTLANIEKVQVVPGPLATPSGEESLDVEWSSSMAPQAKIRVYASFDLTFINIDRCYQSILNDLPTQPAFHQLSLSYGAQELFVSPVQMLTDAQYFASMAAAGVTVFVSSGDDGSAPGGTLQVESPTNDPSVTSVGGTSLVLEDAGGVHSEEVWNQLAINEGATGGGSSAFFDRPAHQTGPGVPSGSFRLVPDVAFAADPETGCLVVLNGQHYQFGGTSWGAPAWAGICALLNQSRTEAGMPSLGLLGPKIYPLIGSANFRDIVKGNNNVSGLYDAGPGFDLCTGVGSPLVANLLKSLARTDLGLPNLTADLNMKVVGPSSVTVGAPMSLSIGVVNTNSNDAGHFVVRYFLSVDTVFDATDTPIGDAVFANGLAGNGKALAAFTGACPNVEPGSYYLVWKIDGNDEVAESNETDNTGFFATKVTVSPNNQLSNLTVDPAAKVVLPTMPVRAGGNVTVSSGVINTGANNAGKFVVRYRLAATALYDPSATFLGDVVLTRGLTANNTVAASYTGACPNVAPGNYYLVWSIDALGEVLESNESDNFGSSATPISVTAANHPPMIVSAPTFSPNPPLANAPISFMVGAIDLDNDPMMVTWDFGDGITITGDSPVHTYVSTGDYLVKVTVADQFGGSVTQSLIVSVTLATKTVTAIKKSFKVEFITFKDALDITFSHPDFTMATMSGEAIEIDIGNQVLDFGSLNHNRGSGFYIGGKFVVNTRKGEVHYIVKNVLLQDLLSAYGVVNTTTAGTQLSIPMSIVINNTIYQGSIPFTYAAKKDKTGSGK